MGVHANIGHDKYPQQGSHFQKTVWVTFNYDTSKRVAGKIIRDDVESPGHTIIQLEDGRVVLGTECQYSIQKVVDVKPEVAVIEG